MATCPKSPVVGGGVGETPVPVKATTCGAVEALSLAVSVPVRVPVAVGVNLTLMVQLAPAARELEQVP